MPGLRQALRVLLHSVSRGDRPLEGTTALWPLGWKEAEARAVELLLRNLSPRQRKQYETAGHFEVIGGDTGKRYRIHRGYQMNVEELDVKGHRTRVWCFTPEGRLPVADVMLAQKNALELFEADAARIANRSPMWEEDQALPFVRRYPRY